MTLHVRVWGPGDENAPEERTLQVTITGASIKDFSNLISAALNCSPNVHPELKELGDMLTHGKVLQDYYATRTDPKPHRP